MSLFSTITLTNLIESLDNDYNDDTKYDYVIIENNEYQLFIDYINKKNSEILGKYKFLYIFTKYHTNIPNVTNICLSQYKKIKDEIESWIKIPYEKYNSNDIGVLLSDTYSFFLKPGMYQVDDRFVVVKDIGI